MLGVLGLVGGVEAVVGVLCCLLVLRLLVGFRLLGCCFGFWGE